MAYKITWHEDIGYDLRKLNKELARKIIKRVATHLIEDPVSLGKALTGQFSGLYRYRYGDYRIIYIIDFEDRIIKILKIGHRKDIYKE